MKLNQIALAVAAACVAAPSFASAPFVVDANTVQLWISGATAPTSAVYKAISSLCTDAVHTYLSSDVAPAFEATDAFPGKSKAGKFAAYACTMGAGTAVGTSLDGKKVVVYHTFDGGSFEAYTPHLVIAGEPANPVIPVSLKRLNNINAAGTAGSTCTQVVGPANTWDNCGTVQKNFFPGSANASAFSPPEVPQGGYSDTEFVLNQLNLGVSKSLGNIGSEVPTNVGQGFGLAVSHPLYRALQVAQGLSACPLNSFTPGSCQPTINRQKYSSLASAGGVTDKDGSLLGGLPGSLIRVERRVGTSGTQSSSNVFFLNKPCATGLPSGELTPSGTNTAGTSSFNTGKVLVRSNNGSSDVKTKLTDATTANELAIGVLSLENVPSATETFAFVKLNGVSPNIDAQQRQTAIDGDYEFWYELVGFTATTASTQGVDLIAATTAALGDPTITDLTGLFVTKNAGVTGANVSKGFKTGNSCSPAIQ